LKIRKISALFAICRSPKKRASHIVRVKKLGGNVGGIDPRRGQHTALQDPFFTY